MVEYILNEREREVYKRASGENFQMVKRIRKETGDNELVEELRNEILKGYRKYCLPIRF